MITLVDVLHHIGIERYDANKAYHYNTCITADIEGSQAAFASQYGNGSTYYFRLENYHHGRKLAAAFYKRLNRHIYDIPETSLTAAEWNKNLYFFVHVQQN